MTELRSLACRLSAASDRFFRSSHTAIGSAANSSAISAPVAQGEPIAAVFLLSILHSYPSAIWHSPDMTLKSGAQLSKRRDVGCHRSLRSVDCLGIDWYVKSNGACVVQSGKTICVKSI